MTTTTRVLFTSEPVLSAEGLEPVIYVRGQSLYLTYCPHSDSYSSRWGIRIEGHGMYGSQHVLYVWTSLDHRACWNAAQRGVLCTGEPEHFLLPGLDLIAVRTAIECLKDTIALESVS